MKSEFDGYAGSILEVDLTERKVKRIPLDSELASKCIGGKGFAARILYDRLPQGCDPFDSENIMVFAAGPLTGTLVPGSGRCIVSTKSPATGLWLDANCGGAFGPEMKMAGVDAIIIKGKASAPVMLMIDDEEVRLRDASDLWRKDTLAVHRWIKDKFGEDFRVACIGEAGEKRVRFASIISEMRAFGRGGAGAVMGSKNLKAIAARGHHPITIAHPNYFIKVCREAFNEMAIHPDSGGARPKYGTNTILSCMNEAGVHPVRNFQKGVFEGHTVLNEEEIQKFYVRNKACYGCPIYCSKISEVKEGRYKGAFVEGPEYENVWSFGAQCENANIPSIIQAEYLCDLYGLDAISTGNVIGFLMECMEREVLEESDIGFPLRFGNDEGILRAIHLIGRREGPGVLWGEGVKRAATEIGKGSESFAVHVKGLEMPAYDPRGSTGIALAYATSDRGACHLRSWPIGAELLSAEERIDPFSTEFKAEFVKSQQDLFTVINASVTCLFAIFSLSLRHIVRFLHSATGIESFASSEEVLKCGERINNLVRLFNLREGLTRGDDTLPKRFLSEPLKEGPSRGRVVDLETMLKEYYFVRGWDEEGVPTLETLKKLELP
ncbi:MAG: aldehyde ferredoxin oxidoreductase family protein [Thermodesulfobacteriota bacterium]